MIKVISIDPGVMTGFATAVITPDKKLRFYPFQATDEVDDLWRRLQSLAPRYIIIEDFEFRQGKQRAGLVLFSKELIGVARLYSLVNPGNCALFLQKAAQGKSYYTDPILKQNGLYKRGIPHGMDAVRHLLQWATFGAGYQYFEGNKSGETFEIVPHEVFLVK